MRFPKLFTKVAKLQLILTTWKNKQTVGRQLRIKKTKTV